jgi:polyisoprenoid-binding protein YceI
MNKLRHVGALVTACASMACVGSAFAAEWNVVKDSSAVRFSAVQQGTRFSGQFGEFEAMIDFDPSNPSTGSIVGVVQTESVSTRDHDRDAALTDADWFNTSEHPEARFESTSIEAGENGSFVANGELTLKGKTNPAKMSFTFDSSDPAAAQFAGTMTVNRFDYNVGEGWSDTSWIGQDVDVEVNLSLTK